ncbi:MAG TPA: polysaccharide biosynthesis tyrosine autokinase [Xanthomonadales bacterium]|nr:polysaccharide biosynthesis tyrosine autokinase [Xanthomonadales bacterium]
MNYSANTSHTLNDPLRQNIGPGSAQEEPLPILEYLQLLWFRRWIIIAFTILSGILGWLWVNQQTPLYRADSTMLIGSPITGVTTPEMMMLAYFNQSRVVDELEVLQSRSLARKVVEKYDLLTYPEFNASLRDEEEPGLLDGIKPSEWIPDEWKENLSSALDRQHSEMPSETTIDQDRTERLTVAAINVLLSGLTLTNEEYSNVVKVGFSSANPEVAALIANELPEAYILSTLQAKYDSTQKATKWLSEQLNELRREVEDAERAVELYRAEHGLTDVGGTGLVTEQLSVLNSQLIIARAERAEAEARLRQVQLLLQQDDGGAEAATRLSGATLIQQLRTQELEAQQRISELSVEYGPKHPRMIQAAAEVEQIQQRIALEVEKIESQLRSELQFARAREAGLQASLNEAELATGEQNRESIQLRALEREAAASRALFETFLEQFKTTSTTEGLNEAGARILSKAEVPGSPYYPNVQRQTTAFAFGGLVLGILLVLALEALTPGITNPEQAEKELRRHILGVVPLVEKSQPEDQPLDKPQSVYVESLNSLLVSLALTNPDHDPKVFQVTSSIPEEGKTTLAISLARQLAASGKSVVLVDGDLRRAAVEKKLGLKRKDVGLSDLVLAPERDLGEFLSKDPKSEVAVLPPGTAAYVNATDLLSSARMKRIIETLRSRFDYVIVDAPPVMAVADARQISQFVEATLFVIRWNKTPVKVAKAALKQLDAVQANIAGIVLQSVDLKRYSRIGYGDSGYYYHYGKYSSYYTKS